MDLNVNTIHDIFAKLKECPDKSNEISVLIRDTLNRAFGDEIKCNRVFISNGNGTDPYFVSVIPKKPTSKILEKKFMKEYDIDIDLTSFMNNHNKNGFTANEMAAWLLHEVAANILTDETLLRFKRLIVKYYDTKENSVLDTIDSYGMMLWIGIFSRTKKCFTTDKLTEVNILLNHWDMADYWNSALIKYISVNGGDISKLTDEYTRKMDKVQLRKFNELARKYSSYTLKYNNTDYSTMVKYIINTTDSELIKHYIQREPQSVPTHPEKMIFLLFDDSKLLLESVGNEEDIYDDLRVVDISKKLDDLKIDINNIEAESNKLLCSAKLKELSRIVDYKFNKINNPSSAELLQQLKYDIEGLKTKLIDKEVDEEISVMELE